VPRGQYRRLADVIDSDERPGLLIVQIAWGALTAAILIGRLVMLGGDVEKAKASGQR
jgi:hypothetical protein